VEGSARLLFQRLSERIEENSRKTSAMVEVAANRLMFVSILNGDRS
jgi:hypothetical protein